jgi:polyferredoxin
MAKKQKFNPTQLMRTITQTAMLLWISGISLTHMYGAKFGFGWPGQSAASLDQYCPMGALETLPTLIGGLAKGQFTFIGGTGFNDLILLGVLLISIILFSGAFCGYLCPFGAAFDILYKLRKLIWKKDIRISPRLATIFSYMRYVTLVALMVTTALVGYLIFTTFDPYRAFFHYGNELTWLTILFMSTAIISSLVFERFACNYICPLGGFVGIVSLAGMTRIVKTKDDGHKCTDCGLCDKACPANLTPSKTLDHKRCYMCSKCVDACVVSESLVFSFAGKEWR